MSTDAAIDRVKSELNRAFDRTHADLERVEILAAGLAAFNTPIPPYVSTTCSDSISRHTSCRRSENCWPDSTLFSGTETFTDDG
jgi:hypothetical protein